MSGRARGWRTGRVAIAGLLVALGSVVATPAGLPVAHAAATTVSNGLTTTDLNAVGMSPASLAAALVGTGVTVSNVTFTGAKAQAGLIHLTDSAVVSFNDGIILSSGNIADVLGPNKSESTTGDMSGGSDADLTSLIANTQTVNPMTYDAAVLEFDFVPQASTIYFTYTFGSDEYLEWVNLFNDVFAFYVNGTNCATTPDGSPVSIDTINDTVNPSLYRDNSFANPPANPINIEPDGLSVELICTAHVNAGVTNHMKLAIADTSDQILDSVVMIKADSLSTVKPESCNDGIDNNDDTKVDMNDDWCKATTTAPPAGSPSSGVGSGSSAPAFTGNEGSPIVLDASVLGWDPAGLPSATSSSWTVTGINGTTGTCDVQPAGKQPRNADGTLAVVYAYCDHDGEYVARVDAWAGSSSDWDTDVDFFVHNAPPVVTLDAPSTGQQVDVGTSVALSAWVTDPGVNDTVTCSVEWGDGAAATGTIAADGNCTAAHTYTTAGTYVVSVTGTDGAGDAAATAAMIDVVGPASNTAPVVTVGGPYSVNEGSAVTISGTATDADSDPLTTSWSVTGPVGATCTLGNAAAITTTLICNDNGAFTATLTADDGTTTTSAVATVNVANVAPTATMTAPASGATVNAGSSVTASATVADVGAHDTLTCTIAWGDTTSSTGTIMAGSCSGTHVYTAAGSRTITVTAKDDDNATGSASRTVNVVVPAPTISSFTPASGAVGTSVLLTGSNFAVATAVKFNTTSTSTFSVLSNTQIAVNVPAGATTGKISVVNAGGTAISTATFTVLAPPTVTSVSPTSGPVGTTVTVNGTNFTGTTAVKFNGLAASSFTVSSATKLTAVVPVGATTGPITVTTPGGTATSGTFTVTVAAPAISSFTPTTAGVGAAITITGTNFTGATVVKFNTTTATKFTVVSSTTIIAGVPAGATTGKISVTTAGGTATSKSSLTVSGTATPMISSLSPTSGPVGTKITVTGTNVGAALSVTVNGVTALYTVTNATTIVVTVPVGATTGKVKITTAGGTATSAGSFTVI